MSLPAFVRDDRIYVLTPYELKETIEAIRTARWDPVRKAWHVAATPAAALALHEATAGYELAPDTATAALIRDGLAEKAATTLKTAADLPEPPGRLPAWLHQKRAYHFARERRGTLLALDMGTGKSRVAVSLLDGWEANRAVIICPRSVAGVWPNQFALHSEREWTCIVPPPSLTVAMRATRVRRELLMAQARRQPAAVILNYEAAWREPMSSLLLHLAEDPTVLILDESHRIKAPGGRASKYAARLAGKAKRVLALTGTPMPHSPLDLYAQFRAIDPGVFGTSFNRYKHRYALFGGFENRQVIGWQREDELARRFGQASVMVSKSDAGLDLPPVVHVERTFELGSRSRRAYDTIERDFVLGVEEGTVTTTNALTKLLRLQQVTSGYVRDDDGADHHVGDDKIEALADVLEDVPTQEPVVIFARFIHDVEAISQLCASQGRRCGIVSGDYGPGHPEYGLTADSKMRDDLDAIVLQIQSGGVGIDLTRAAIAVYYSLDFNLGNFEQSLARLDRPGQTRSVTYFHLIARSTKDSVVYTALRDRKDVVEAVIDSAKADERGDQAA